MSVTKAALPMRPDSPERGSPDDGQGTAEPSGKTGRKAAESIYMRHFIFEVRSDLPWPRPRQDACRSGHDLSRQSFEKLKACWEKIVKGERKL